MIPLFHHSIIPVWNMQNDWLGIPYYQQFVEFPLHLNSVSEPGFGGLMDYLDFEGVWLIVGIAGLW
jgi:hypothetical protein